MASTDQTRFTDLSNRSIPISELGYPNKYIDNIQMFDLWKSKYSTITINNNTSDVISLNSLCASPNTIAIKAI